MPRLSSVAAEPPGGVPHLAVQRQALLEEHQRPRVVAIEVRVPALIVEHHGELRGVAELPLERKGFGIPRAGCRNVPLGTKDGGERHE